MLTWHFLTEMSVYGTQTEVKEQRLMYQISVPARAYPASGHFRKSEQIRLGQNCWRDLAGFGGFQHSSVHVDYLEPKVKKQVLAYHHLSESQRTELT